MAKNIYGSPEKRSHTEWFWAYAVVGMSAVMVRCPSVDDASEEKDRLKQSDAKVVGFTNRRASEMEVRSHLRSRGFKVSLIRDC